MLEAVDLAALFGAVVGGGEGPLTPHPFALQTALARVGVAPARAWMVGDGPRIVVAGRPAGATTIAIRGGFGAEAMLRGASPDAR